VVVIGAVVVVAASASGSIVIVTFVVGVNVTAAIVDVVVINVECFSAKFSTTNLHHFLVSL